MGGLTLNVRDRIPIGVPVVDYIEPGVRRLNGFQTLWFARSRESADDYSRMARQKCVMSAMLQQLSPQTVLTKFEALAEASTHLIETDLPASEVGEFTQLALKAKSQKVGTVSFVPPAINTSDPDIDKIRSMIDDAIAKSEAAERLRHGHAKGPGFTQVVRAQHRRLDRQPVERLRRQPVRRPVEGLLTRSCRRRLGSLRAPVPA